MPALTQFAIHSQVLSAKGMRTLSSKWWGGLAEDVGGNNQVRRVKKADAGRRSGIVRGEEVGGGGGWLSNFLGSQNLNPGSVASTVTVLPTPLYSRQATKLG